MLLFKIFENDPILIVPWLAALVIALTIHEFAHAFAAYRLGDDTAAQAGRLTLNPLSHLDPIGALMLLMVGFGWAKPVPVNIHRLRKGNLGKVIVSFAGVFFNIIMAVVCILLLKYFVIDVLPLSNMLVRFFGFLIYINIALFAFNLLPIPPLDGYHIVEYFFPSLFEKFSMFMNRWGMMILLIVVFATNIIGYVISWAVYIFSILFKLNISLIAFYGL